MTDAEYIEQLKKELGGKAVEITNPSVRRIFVKTDPSDLVGVVTTLRDKFGYAYLATISGLDKGETFEIIYHFGNPHNNLNLRTEIPRANPHIKSITPIIPGAILYERELQDMFGMIIDDIPDNRQLILPDDWPAGNFPLRKDWKYERPPEVIPGGKK